MTALEQPSRDRQRPRRRRRAWPVVLAVVAAGALLFAFGVAFGMALHDDPEPGDGHSLAHADAAAADDRVDAVADRSRCGQTPCLPGIRIPFGSSASLIVSARRRPAESLKSYAVAHRSMKSMCERYSP